MGVGGFHSRPVGMAGSLNVVIFALAGSRRRCSGSSGESLSRTCSSEMLSSPSPLPPCLLWWSLQRATIFLSISRYSLGRVLARSRLWGTALVGDLGEMCTLPAVSMIGWSIGEDVDPRRRFMRSGAGGSAALGGATYARLPRP